MTRFLLTFALNMALIFTTFQSLEATRSPLLRYKVSAPTERNIDIELEELVGTEKAKLSDFKGKITVVNFWAPWCMPCLAEMPSLNNLGKIFESEEDFQLVAVVKDEKGQIKPTVVVERAGLYYMKHYKGFDQKLFEEFKISGLPTTVFLDREGREVGRLEGGTKWDAEEVVKLIQDYISGKVRTPKAPSLWERFKAQFVSLFKKARA